MSTELQPPQIPIPPPPADEPITLTAPTAAATPLPDNPSLPVAPKRQRRPSVRLGEIGDQPATLRTKNPWSHHRVLSSKHSRTRPITNLVNGHEFHDEEKRVKSKRGLATKRFRSNWVSKTRDGAEGENGDQSVEFRAFDIESDSPVKGNSLVNSGDNIDVDAWDRRTGDDGVELDNYPESDSRARRCGSSERVRSFLIDLGLSRYMPVFEIHEVDDEVLPLLTLEDLKDMGINAVGSRRKMYASIQKLRRGYSS